MKRWMTLLALAGAFVGSTAAGAAKSTTIMAKNARPLSPAPFERTPVRIERGRYLVNGIGQCFICHSERDWDKPGAPPRDGMLGAGQVLVDEADKRIVAPNLTPDVATGAGGWPDDALARAIREGVGHDGRVLNRQMWSQAFRHLSDNDVRAVVVYLRTLPAVSHALPASRWKAGGQRALEPLRGAVPDPGASALERGRYLIQIADCMGCHTSWYSTRMPGAYAGGNLIRRGTRQAFSTNITHDPSGVMADRAGFIALIRSGKSGTLSPLMPWIVFRNLDDDDLDAIRLTLAGLAPVSHYISNALAPTHCAACGQEHGLGDANRIVIPEAKVTLTPAQLAALAGRYRAREDGTIDIVRVVDGKLYRGDGKQSPAIELVAQTPTSFAGSGLLLPVRFELDERGRAARMIEDDIEPFVFDRIGKPTAGGSPR